MKRRTAREKCGAVSRLVTQKFHQQKDQPEAVCVAAGAAGRAGATRAMASWELKEARMRRDGK